MEKNENPLTILFSLFYIDMAPVGRAAVAPPQMRPPMMPPGPPAGMMQGIYKKITFGVF